MGVWAVPSARLMVMSKSESLAGEEAPQVVVVSVVVVVVLVTALVAAAAEVVVVVGSRDTVKSSPHSYQQVGKQEL